VFDLDAPTPFDRVPRHRQSSNVTQRKSTGRYRRRLGRF
jgi:hypothetical protein